MTFPQAVFDGDHITARGVVTAVREEGGERLADCEIWLEREGSARVLDGQATVVLPD